MAKAALRFVAFPAYPGDAVVPKLSKSIVSHSFQAPT